MPRVELCVLIKGECRFVPMPKPFPRLKFVPCEETELSNVTKCLQVNLNGKTKISGLVAKHEGWAYTGVLYNKDGSKINQSLVTLTVNNQDWDLVSKAEVCAFMYLNYKLTI